MDNAKDHGKEIIAPYILKSFLGLILERDHTGPGTSYLESWTREWQLVFLPGPFLLILDN